MSKLRGEYSTELTPREKEVVSYVCKGFRNKEIANQLGVSENTIKNMMNRIFDKSGVFSRTELAIKFHPTLQQLPPR